MLSTFDEQFEKFIDESFSKDVYVRELRLSKQEVQYVKAKFPKANVKPFSTEKSIDGKSWYTIQLVTGEEAVAQTSKRETKKYRVKQQLKISKKNSKEIIDY